MHCNYCSLLESMMNDIVGANPTPATHLIF